MTSTKTKPVCRLEKGVFLTEPVRLTGYQACLKPSKFGYSLRATVPDSIVPLLESDRESCIKWAQSKLTNPKRSVCKPEPWQEDEETPGNVILKFSWSEDPERPRPYFVDSEGTPITDDGLPLYSDSLVRLAFKQKAYLLKDGVTYGTSLKLAGVQVISLNREGVGSDAGDLTEEDIANLFRVSDTTGLDAEEFRAAKAAAVEDDPDLDF